VEVNHEVVLGSQLRDVVVPLDALLIVAVDEVDLDSGDAPLLEERERLLHLLRYRFRVAPDPHLHIFGGGVTSEPGYVDLAVHVRDVATG
jgi:hypothetical protein